MKRWVSYEELIELVEGDRELVTTLIQEQMIIADPEGFDVEDVDLVLASRTLVRELEVNWAGVDIILRLRRELAVARKRIAVLEGHEPDDYE